MDIIKVAHNANDNASNKRSKFEDLIHYLIVPDSFLEGLQG